MDRAVLDAYGWTDIPTTCEFFALHPDDEPDPDPSPARNENPTATAGPTPSTTKSSPASSTSTPTAPTAEQEGRLRDEQLQIP